MDGHEAGQMSPSCGCAKMGVCGRVKAQQGSAVMLSGAGNGWQHQDVLLPWDAWVPLRTVQGLLCFCAILTNRLIWETLPLS